MSVVGQPKHGQGKTKPGEIHCICSLMSKTGVLIDLIAMQTEKASKVVLSASSKLGKHSRSVKVFKVDRPWDYDNAYTFSIFVGLLGILEDPMHRCFNVEEGFGKNSSQLSSTLRAIHSKFSVPARNADLVLYSFRTKDQRRFGQALPQNRVQDLLLSMTTTQAEALLQSLSITTPFVTAQYYYRLVAALIISFPRDMTRSAGKGTVKEVLLNGATFKHFQYLQNNSRYLRMVVNRSEIPVGTTCNEALHRELKGFFANVWTQTKQRLELALTFFVFSKHIFWHFGFNLELAKPIDRQNELLKRILATARRSICKNPNALCPLPTSSERPSARKAKKSKKVAKRAKKLRL